MEAVAETGRHVVDLVGTIDLDRFARGAEGDLAVLTSAQVLLQVTPHLGGYRVVDQVIEHGEELSARHFSTPFFF